MTGLLNRFLKDASGATAIEYGLIVALVAVVIIAGISSIGTGVNGVMTNLSGNVTAK